MAELSWNVRFKMIFVCIFRTSFDMEPVRASFLAVYECLKLVKMVFKINKKE